MKRWIAYLLMLLLVLGILDYYFRAKLPAQLDLDLIFKAHNKTSGAPARAEKVSDAILALRQRHHLKPLNEMEKGTPVREVPNGTYGFATCEVQTVHTTRTNSPLLEIHKHLDGIVYYVGYASEDHIEKYLTRQKNFHILVSSEARGKASVLLEIPVDFVTKCTASAGGNGQFDLFVTAIPELLSFRPASDFYAKLPASSG